MGHNSVVSGLLVFENLEEVAKEVNPLSKGRLLWIFPPSVALGLFHSVCSERSLNPSGV
jgi:hypothetical protein